MIPNVRHAHDPWVGYGTQVWHNDDKFEAFVEHLIETVKPDRFVETGTNMGWTSCWVAQKFPWLPIYTVECAPRYFQIVKENFAPYPQIAFSEGDSVDFLARLKPVLIRGLSLFWLDAHWWENLPLRKECEVVAGLDRYACLIDDFECKDPNFEGDVYKDIRIGLPYVSPPLPGECWRPNYEAKPGFKGYGLFLKDVDYVAPSTMRRDVLQG
jgi:hypothetical protein